jgi:hypothetical protein
MFTNEMPRAKLHVVGIDTLLSSGGLSSTDVDVAIATFPELTYPLHRPRSSGTRGVMAAWVRDDTCAISSPAAALAAAGS